MEIRVLGPIEAEHDGQRLSLGGPKQRLVLAVLLAQVNETVSTDRIVDAVWNDDPPATAHRTVQAYISTLRKVLEPCRPGTLSARQPGYVIELDEDTFDVLRFQNLIHQGRTLTTTDPEAATRLLRKAESLWRGNAYADLVGAPSLVPEMNRLHELRITGIEARIDAELALGHHATTIPELEALVETHPLREGLRAQLMTALYRCGRQAEALRLYQRTRHVLGEELGLEPSRELQHLEELILDQDPNLGVGRDHEAPVVPAVRYATTADAVSIAHYAVGSGDVDLVYVPGWISNIETIWEHELPSRFLSRLASMSRLICLDKRGTGLSDRVPVTDLPDLETRTDDIRAVLDAVGSEHAVVFGASEGGAMAALFAATYPERTEALILYGSFPCTTPSPDCPWALSSEARKRWWEFVERHWGGEPDLRTLAPSMQTDMSFRAWWSHYLRSGASPAAVAALGRMNAEVDVRGIVGSIDVPTLVMHRTADRLVPVEAGRWFADHIRGARIVEFAGNDHMAFVSSDEILDEIHSFLTGLTRTGSRR